jgi:multidrug efflux system membrane fusion protein
MHSGDFKIGRRRSLRPGLVTAMFLCVVAGGVTWYWTHGSEPAQTARARPPVPVSIASAEIKDVPIYLTGLGTVQATFTVGIHSQIDGKLQDVLFTEGQRVKKGELLAKIDPRLFQAALDQAKAKRAQDEATLAGLEKDLARFKTLGTRGFETQQNIDQQTAKVDTTRAAIVADEAAIETAQTQLDYTEIRAPSDGRMGVRMVDPGNVVRASDSGSIAVLVQAQPAIVLFTLPADTLDDVRAAIARGTVEAQAYDRNNKVLLSTGTLATIDNLIDQTTASYRLKATFANEDERLWPGQFVNARLLVDTRKNAITVPNAAIQRGPKGPFVWVVSEKKTAVARSIAMGPSGPAVTVVDSGVEEGDQVITGGQYKLSDDAPVSISADGRQQAAGEP